MCVFFKLSAPAVQPIKNSAGEDNSEVTATRLVPVGREFQLKLIEARISVSLTRPRARGSNNGG